MVVNIEDAGFEIRDQIGWAYGSGFPKSYNVGQSVEKLLTTGKSRRSDRDLGGLDRNRYSGSNEGTLFANTGGQVELTKDEAKEWDGWGTALKPAWEPIVVARKPLSEKTVVANVLKWGTGAINIDDCRVECEPIKTTQGQSKRQQSGEVYSGKDQRDKTAFENHPAGRWPANIIHDGSDEVVDAFPETGVSSGGRIGNAGGGNIQNIPTGQFTKGNPGFGDKGSASRFFYCAKASKKERGNANKHPTVKPLALMTYLCRLVTPPNGVVLDPFMGSGSTGVAALQEGFAFVGAELDTDSFKTAKDRVKNAKKRA